MSTNTDLKGLPDVKALERLANQFFSALPGSSVPGDAAPGQQPANALSNNDILLQHGELVNMSEPQTSLHDPHFAGTGIPKSVAGSGISPSAKEHQAEKEGFVSSVEQASVPAWLKEAAPAKTSQGGGRQSVPTGSSQGYGLPLASELSYETELQRALSAISAYVPSAQLPSHAIPSFYFLPETIQQRGQAVPTPPFDVNRAKADFPILQQYVNGRPLVWLDNAATTQKPQQVIDRISRFYEYENSNIHRAAHELAARATDAYEEARRKVQQFLNAASPNEIIFVRGATEAINLVAKSWGEQYLGPGDEIILSHLEHHANIVPWQQLAARKNLHIRVIPVDDDGQVILDEYTRLLSPKTKLVSFTQVSNALGTVTPAKRIVELAHQAGAKVLVDGAQAVSHMRADVTYLDCDWYAFSGHKVFGPTGIGVLYGKEALLNETQPWQGGGNMIKDVTFEHTSYHASPTRFEAGTGNIADAVGLGAAIDYVNTIGIDAIHQYEQYLLAYATRLLREIPGLRLIGTAPDKAGVLSFVLDGFRTEDVGAALNREGIAVRSGHHCAQPILRRFGVESSVRPSLALYNTCADIDALVAALSRIRTSRFI